MSEYNLGVTELFRGSTRRDLLAYAYGCEDRWHTKRDLADAIDGSTESVREHIGRGSTPTDPEQPGPLVRFGIYQPKDLTGNIVRYRPHIESDPYQLLQLVPDRSIADCIAFFGSDARRKLTAFFMDEADPEADYSKNQVVTEANVSRYTVNQHMDNLVEFGILDTVEAPQGPRYTLADSEIVDYLYTLNEVLLAHYEDFDASQYMPDEKDSREHNTA